MATALHKTTSREAEDGRAAYGGVRVAPVSRIWPIFRGTTLFKPHPRRRLVECGRHHALQWLCLRHPRRQIVPERITADHRLRRSGERGGPILFESVPAPWWVEWPQRNVSLVASRIDMSASGSRPAPTETNLPVGARPSASGLV